MRSRYRGWRMEGGGVRLSNVNNHPKINDYHVLKPLRQPHCRIYSTSDDLFKKIHGGSGTKNQTRRNTLIHTADTKTQEQSTVITLISSRFGRRMLGRVVARRSATAILFLTPCITPKMITGGKNCELQTCCRGLPAWTTRRGIRCW